MIHYILCLAPPSSVWCFQISPCKYIFMLILVEQLRRLTCHLVVTDTEYNLCHENHVYRGCFGTQMITYIASPLTLKYGVAGYQSKVVQNNKHNSIHTFTSQFCCLSWAFWSIPKWKRESKNISELRFPWVNPLVFKSNLNMILVSAVKEVHSVLPGDNLNNWVFSLFQSPR